MQSSKTWWSAMKQSFLICVFGLNCSPNFWYIGVLVFLVQALLDCTLDAAVPCPSYRQFTIMKSPTMGPARLGPGWQANNKLSCVKNCVAEYKRNCRAFMYNSTSKLCTPGSWLNQTNPLPTKSEGLLYVRTNASYCHTAQGFNLYNYGSTYACLAKFEDTVDFNTADVLCRQKGGFLMAVKTWDKLMLLRDFPGDTNVWVGLNDLGVEGTFTWMDDGSECTYEQISTLFPESEPNGEPDREEDCVQIKYNDLLNDENCNETMSYACEHYLLD